MASDDLVRDDQVAALVAVIADAVLDRLLVGGTLGSLSLDTLGGPVQRIEIVGSGGSTPNAWEFAHDGNLTMHANEFGELRGAPSSDSRVAARWFGHSLEQSANVVEVMDRKATPREVVFSIGPDGTVTAPNVVNGLVTYDDTTTPTTTGVAVGTLFAGYDADG